MNSKKPGAGRYQAFAALCVICAGAALGYMRYSARRISHPSVPSSPAAPLTSTGRNPASADLSVSRRGARLLFRTTALGPHFGRLGVVALDALDQPRYIEQLSCERVAFAGGEGVCLSGQRGLVSTFHAEFFDSAFQRHGTLILAGPPSRTRLSPDGRLAAVTVFLSGHSYAADSMSTQTLLLDTKAGAVVSDLEAFVIRQDSATLKKEDFNFWGVTFCPDGNQFYATLASGGERYLIKGDARAREAKILYKGIECPVLSPDGTRVAFKKRSTTPLSVTWRLHVLNLATLKETALLETRSVDDQVEWLDDRNILYGLLERSATALAKTNIWVLPADASGPPRKFLADASSPAIF